MADAFKVLGQAVLAQAASTTTIVTVPASTEAIVKHIRVINNAAGDATVKLWHDTAGVGALNITMILPDVTLGAGEWGEFDGTILMEAGDILIGQSDTANAITAVVYGDEVT
jgi:hypothetical protein